MGSVSSISDYHRNMNILASQIASNGEEKGKMQQLYQTFKSFNVPKLYLVDKFMQSMAEGYVNEENGRFFDSITMRYVNGILPR